MKALILVDLQNDFVEGGALAVPGGREIIPLANRLQKHFDLIVATQDWHPRDHGSHACNHLGRQPGEVIDLGGQTQILWPAHCVQGTPGADFVEGLDNERWTAVFQKGTDPAIDSYSGFFDNGGKHATGLDAYLKARGVTEVFLLGLATDYCVKFTALDAVNLGYATFLILDACRGVNLRPGDVKLAVREMIAHGIRVVTAREAVRLRTEVVPPPAAKRPEDRRHQDRPGTVTPPACREETLRNPGLRKQPFNPRTARA